MLASSSHMNGARQLGGYLQNLPQRLSRKGVIETLVDVIQRHAVREALKNQCDG